MNDKLTLIAAIFIEAFSRQTTSNIAAVTIRAMLADDSFSVSIDNKAIRINVIDFAEDANLSFSIMSHGKNIMVRAVEQEKEDPIYRNITFAEATHALHFVLDCANNRDIEDIQPVQAVDETWGAYEVPDCGEKEFVVPEPVEKQEPDISRLDCALAWLRQHKKSIYLNAFLRKEFGLDTKVHENIVHQLVALDDEAIIAVSLKYEGDTPVKLNKTTGIFGSLDRGLHRMAYESTSTISRIVAWVKK